MITEKNLRQFLSSEPSLHSRRPLHLLLAGMQVPSLQRNLSAEHPGIPKENIK